MRLPVRLRSSSRRRAWLAADGAHRQSIETKAMTGSAVAASPFPRLWGIYRLGGGTPTIGPGSAPTY